MAKDTGFLEFRRQDPSYRPIEERLSDSKDVVCHLAEDDIVTQATRCMDCGVPFCHGCGCPVANMIPQFNDHVYRGRWEEALKVLLATNPFPEFTGRICPAPCEASCVLGINDDPVSIREIELAVVEHGFAAGLIRPQLPKQRTGKRVAVVGSGPAGLAAAHRLNHAGQTVTVFEHDKKPGGILRYGIPDFKLEKWVVDRRVTLMEEEGVEFECGIDVGEDLSARYLEGRFDAIVLTGGARDPRGLPVPGCDLAGVHYAMDFLTQQNRLVDGETLADGEDRILAEGKRVVVIGGGDTGSDCIGTSRRQGCVSVVQLEILPEPPEERPEDTPWPLWPRTRRDSSSHKEGCERFWSVMTESFEGDDGVVTAVNCVDVEWTAPTAGGGRAAPVRLDGTERRIDADLVLLAMGFVGPGNQAVVDALGVSLDERGMIARDEHNMTSVEGVFVAGDMTRGASLVVRAIEDGKRVASRVCDYLG